MIEDPLQNIKRGHVLRYVLIENSVFVLAPSYSLPAGREAGRMHDYHSLKRATVFFGEIAQMLCVGGDLLSPFDYHRRRRA